MIQGSIIHLVEIALELIAEGAQSGLRPARADVLPTIAVGAIMFAWYHLVGIQRGADLMDGSKR